jgi:DNA-directed RNA polymerase specialized sigma24 family protein
MGNGRTGSIAPDLFAVASPQETVPGSPDPRGKAAQRHVLPSDLPNAIKHLTDQELDQLLTAVTEEQLRRGKKLPTTFEKIANKRVETAAVSLTPGKLNAVRATYKAGITLSKIAKQFGIPQSDVRKALSK